MKNSKAKPITFLALDCGKDTPIQGIPTGHQRPGYVELRYTVNGKEWRSLIPLHRILEYVDCLKLEDYLEKPDQQLSLF
jgi:hypothetical protein